MDAEHEYSVETARRASEADELGRWVSEFLRSPGSDNEVLAEELPRRMPWWIGPVQLPIDQLNRLAGPPDAPVLRPMGDDEWRDDVEEMEEKVEDGWEPPPVVVAYRDGQLVLEDGNHRVESLRRAGVDEAWAVVGFETEDDRDRFTTR
jgi:hypothetical protein